MEIMEINEHQIRLTGKANLISGLENGKEYDLTISSADVRKIEEVPNDDGTYNRVATLKISEMSEVNIISEKEVIKSKSKKSASQRLRGRSYVWCSENDSINDSTDDEAFYQLIVNKIINNFDLVVEILKDK